MKRFPFRPILAGVLIGAALFFVPFFLLRVALFVLLIGTLFRIFGRRRWRGMHRYDAYNYGQAPSASNIIHLRSRDVQDIGID